MHNNANQYHSYSDFLESLARYYRDFLETDFHRRTSPKRRVKLRDSDGQSTGTNLNKYPCFRDEIWKLFKDNTKSNNKFNVSKGRYKSKLKSSLKFFIEHRIESISQEKIDACINAILQELKILQNDSADNWNHFFDEANEVLRRNAYKDIVLPLLDNFNSSLSHDNLLEIEKEFELEEDLIDLVCNDLQSNFEKPLIIYFSNAEEEALATCCSEFLNTRFLHSRLKDFFEGFTANDLFFELNELFENKKLKEKQELYLYFCDIKHNNIVYPLFYFPLTVEKDDETFALNFDPRIFINKKAIEYIVQEYSSDATKANSISSLNNRIIYLEPDRDSVAGQLHQLVFDITTHFKSSDTIDLDNPKSKTIKSYEVTLSNTIYFCLFDKSDESLINDYEELVVALAQGKTNPINDTFKEIIQDYILKEPKSYNAEVENDWEGKSVPERLIYEAPIPLNEEQKKVASSLNKPDCRFVTVQGPPGTGKSHTITAIAFEAIVKNKSVLILSDKQEALDVVEDKIVQTLNKVRTSQEFINPILRLDKRNFGKIFSSSVITKLKEYHQAAKQKEQEIKALVTTNKSRLTNDLTDIVNSYAEIQLPEIVELIETEEKLTNQLKSFQATSERVLGDGELINDLHNVLVLIRDRKKKAIFQKFITLLQEHCQNWTDKEVQDVIKLFELVAYLFDKGLFNRLSKLSEVDGKTQKRILQGIAEYNRIANPTKYQFVNSLIAWFKRKEINLLNKKINKKVKFSFVVDLKRDLKLLSNISTDLIGALRVFKQKGFSEQKFLKNYWDLLSYPHTDDIKIFSETEKTSFECFTRISNEKSIKILHEAGISLSFEKTNTPGTLDDYIAFAELLIKRFKLNREVTTNFSNIPQIDYRDDCANLEQLHTTIMTNLIDERVIDIAENKRSSIQSLKWIFSKKQKFPKDYFDTLIQAFPCIIAGIRDFAEYIPLEKNLFDLVIIDEASQVSIAQAFPAVLRAKKILVLGDNKQFSNVKTSRASKSMNDKYMEGIKASYRAHISQEKYFKVEPFNIQTSILEFFASVTNYDVMLKKHFRGYRELISFSSKYFYNGGLQAIKIRGKPVSEVLKFHNLEHDGLFEIPQLQNTNSFEAEYIIQQLELLVINEKRATVGVITPFTNQQKYLAKKVSESNLSDDIYSQLKLKVMTFDSCQGEERDIIFYSMVASRTSDRTNYIFAKDLSKADYDDEKKIRLQRLNVGFSRAKECMHFVLSKPIVEFSGSIGEAIKHYHNVLITAKNEPTPDDVDKNSPMERKVLEWIKNTAFYQNNFHKLELHTQFPVGEYLQQLDHTYRHPKYRCDFLLQYSKEGKTTNIIIEYDGFKEHFTDLKEVNKLNYHSYYKPDDIEREKILESYGFRFVRINKFNLGKDPVNTLSKRLEEIIFKKSIYLNVTEEIIAVADQLGKGNMKECPKCGQIKALEAFKDSSLRSGMGRNCMPCKNNSNQNSNFHYNSFWK